MKHRYWTPAALEELRALYPDEPTGMLATKFQRPPRQIYSAARRYGLRKSAAYLLSPAACRLRRGDNVGAAFRFRKGHVPANKGLRRPGWAPGRMKETQFKRGQQSRNYLPVGTTKPDSYGYLRVKIADGPGGFGNREVWAYVHKRVWEAAHGPIPPGYRLWWKDGDHSNNSLENLELLGPKEHMARTTIHNLPPVLKEVIVLKTAVERRIRRLENGQKSNR